MTQSEWIDIIRAVSPVLAALLAGGVAWKFGSIQAGIARQQAETAAASAKTARNKLKLDLFDRRWAIYSIAIDAMRKAIGNDGWSSDERYQYTVAVLGARWIMDERADEYLTKTIPQLIDAFHLACMNFNSSSLTEERTAFSHDRVAARTKLFAQLTEIDKVFEEHLKLES